MKDKLRPATNKYNCYFWKGHFNIQCVCALTVTKKYVRKKYFAANNGLPLCSHYWLEEKYQTSQKGISNSSNHKYQFKTCALVWIMHSSNVEKL